MKDFACVIQALFQEKTGQDALTIYDSVQAFEQDAADDSAVLRKMNAAFFILLMGTDGPSYESASGFLDTMAARAEWKEAADFYRSGAKAVTTEMDAIGRDDPELASSLQHLAAYLRDPQSVAPKDRLTEMIHAVFFPEAVGINPGRREQVAGLRNRRAVTVSRLNPSPVDDPIQQILFTSNVLLTVPSESTPIDDLPLSDALKAELTQVASEPQCYWYDHPIQIGVERDKNEILYGLKGLDQAVEFERGRGNVPPHGENDAKLAVVLSVSVTHKGLQAIAGHYLKEELRRAGGLKNIDVYLFTEADARQAVTDVMMPVLRDIRGGDSTEDGLRVFGVDGEYGRHYSFLKAIAAFWQVCIRPDVKATFKIDLDQVFPQEELVNESGASAFEHLMTPLWGAEGRDGNGDSVELGLIAGALVNETDIEKSLFTPDVTFPDGALSPDEYIFYNRLPQALSTEAEMMARYDSRELDGNTRCLQRVHVTGGTNGILVDALRLHRPFTPSFIGRAEDQAYIMSVMLNQGKRLAYVHKDGLIMRHDKEAFAQEAIRHAHIGKLIGDYIRILNYSAYANVLSKTIAALKRQLDPFTGCFISRIPLTIVYLRFALRAASFFVADDSGRGHDFIVTGIPRITAAIRFTQGNPSPLAQEYERERREWDLYYDGLVALEEALKNRDPVAVDLQNKAKKIINKCRF